MFFPAMGRVELYGIEGFGKRLRSSPIRRQSPLACADFYARYHNSRRTKKCSRQHSDNSCTLNDCRWQRERVPDVSRALEYQWFTKADRNTMDGILLARFSRLRLPGGSWSCFLYQTIKSALAIARC